MAPSGAMPGIAWAVLVQNAGLAAHSQTAGGLRVFHPVRLFFDMGLAGMVQWLGDLVGVPFCIQVRDS